MICSVFCSIGICAAAGIATTLLTIEVVPFLVLAVGVDNIFIIVQTCQRNPRSKDQPLENYIGDIMAKVGPSMLLTSSCEIGCFAVGEFILLQIIIFSKRCNKNKQDILLVTVLPYFKSFLVGSLSDMPAVNTFAIYATVAMTFNFILQTTTFIAILTIDESRYEVRFCKLH